MRCIASHQRGIAAADDQVIEHYCSTVAPDCLTSTPKRSISLLRKRAKTSGVLPTGCAPCADHLGLISCVTRGINVLTEKGRVIALAQKLGK